MSNKLTDPIRPLLGKTVLVIDGRRSYAETLRLIVLHCGGRIRRADSLANAQRHLAAYRPSAILMAEMLPDCSAEELAEFVKVDLNFPEGPSRPVVQMHQDIVWSKANLVGLLELPVDGVDTDEVTVGVEVVKEDLDALAELRSVSDNASATTAWSYWAEQTIAIDFPAQYKQATALLSEAETA